MPSLGSLMWLESLRTPIFMVAMRTWRAGKKRSVKSGRRYGTTSKRHSLQPLRRNRLCCNSLSSPKWLLLKHFGVSHVDAEPRYVGADGATYDTMIEPFVHAMSHLDLSGSPEPQLMKAVRFTGRQYSHSAKKELTRKAKSQHKAWMSTLTLARTASSMSRHTPGLATCMISDVEAIKVPPAV